MRLVQASERQKEERDVLAHEAWGARLTPEQFLERERLLRAHPWPRRAMTTWLWVDERGDALASCETFSSPSWLRGRKASSHGVASVYTEPRLRGRGHATALMDALVAELRRRDPDAHAVTLYSDVGAAIYARSGFVPLPAVDWVLPPAPGDPATVVDALMTAPSAPPPPDEPFVIWPDDEQLDWHLERERIYARLLGRPGLAWCGAEAGGCRALWAANLKSDELLVLLLSPPHPGALRALLEAARRAAASAALGRVVVWEDASLEPTFASLEGASRSARSGSLPMICPLTAGLKPDDWRLRPRALWV